MVVVLLAVAFVVVPLIVVELVAVEGAEAAVVLVSSTVEGKVKDSVDGSREISLAVVVERLLVSVTG